MIGSCKMENNFKKDFPIFKGKDIVYLDSAATSKKMTTSANKITIPKRKNYVFKGYYQYSGGGGKQLISTKKNLKNL